MLLVATAIAGCGKSGRKDADRVAGQGSAAAVTKTWSAKEASRALLHGPHPARVAALADGGALVASYFEDTVTVDGTTFASRGNEDLLVHRVGPDGKLGAGIQLGGTGGEAAETLQAVGDGAYLAIRANDPIEIAGKTFAPRPPDPARTFDIPTTTVFVRLDRDGKPVSAFATLPDVNGVRIDSLPGGDLVLIGSAMGKDSVFGHTDVLRVGPDGAQRWTVRFDNVEGNEIVAASDTELVMSVRADNMLGMWTLDAASGKVLRKQVVTKPADMNDLGELSPARRLGALDIALGSTGGTVILDGKSIDGGHLHPFFLASSAKGLTYAALPDSVAVPLGSGLVHGTPFYGMQVIHTGDDKTFHRGIYLVAYGAKPQLLPVYQYRYDNDDWEHAPKQIVLGDSLDGWVAFGKDTAWIAGHCSDNPPRVGCVVKVDLSAK